MVASRSSKKGSYPQQLRGVVTSAGKVAKTITVSVERLVWHPKVRKQYRRTKNYLAHDEKEEARIGDIVTIEKCRPLSRRKSFRVVECVSKNSGKDLRGGGERVGG